MAARPPSVSRLDSRTARLAGLAVAIAGIALMIWLGRDDIHFVRAGLGVVSGAATAPASTGNPELDACLAQRVGDVDTMRADGVINEAQYTAFKGRAVSYCEAQFPPL